MAKGTWTVRIRVHTELSHAIYWCLHTLNRAYLYPFREWPLDFIDVEIN